MSEKKQTWQDELDTLLARLVDEELSTTDTKRLNEILSDNPAARDQYHAYMDVHEALQEQFVIEALGVEAEGKRTEGPGVPLREIKNGDWQFVVEEVTILRQQGEIDDEAFHSANVD